MAVSGGCHGDSPVAQRVGQRIDLVIPSGKYCNIARSRPLLNQVFDPIGHSFAKVTSDLPEFERWKGLNTLLPVMGFQSCRRTEDWRKDGIGRPNQLFPRTITFRKTGSETPCGVRVRFALGKLLRDGFDHFGITSTEPVD